MNNNKWNWVESIENNIPNTASVCLFVCRQLSQHMFRKLKFGEFLSSSECCLCLLIVYQKAFLCCVTYVSFTFYWALQWNRSFLKKKKMKCSFAQLSHRYQKKSHSGTYFFRFFLEHRYTYSISTLTVYLQTYCIE